MIVKTYVIELLIYNSYSLKNKRSAIKSLIQRIRKRFNVSIAEISDNELWNKATIGISCISNSNTHCDNIFDNIINFIDNDNRVEIIKISIS